MHVGFQVDDGGGEDPVGFQSNNAPPPSPCRTSTTTTIDPTPASPTSGPLHLALLATLNAECDNAAQLGQAAIETFQQHPDHEVITSFPGMGELSGARLLAEIGDDRIRFADVRALKAYAGSAQ